MKTQKSYINFLNEIAPDYESEKWIIGGKRRERLANSGKYGEALKKYDPVGFQVGFNEWKQNN